MTDMELLRRYAAADDHGAFAELVRRHIDWVYSTCRRQVRDPALAQDVTQVVFLTLARRAGSLPPTISLTGWLFTTCRFAAASALRMERRRRRHEREAAVMRPPVDDAEMENRWQQMEPVLDAALARLPAADRDAIILRYYRGLSHHELGGVLGITEQAAQKRVARALERLRMKLPLRPALSAALIGTLLARKATHAAPAALIKASAAATGAAWAPHIEALVKGVLIMQKISSAKFIAAAAVAVLLLLGGGSYIAVRQIRSPASQAPLAEEPLVMSDLHEVQTLIAEGTNDDGVPTTLISSRARGAVARQTFPFGTRVQVVSLVGEEWDYLEGKPEVVHFLKKRASLGVLMPEMEEQFKLVAKASASRQATEDATLDGVDCQAFALNEGALAQGMAWIDPQTHRLRGVRLAKVDFKFRYDAAVAANIFDIPGGQGVRTINAAEFLEEQYPVTSAKYIAQVGPFVFAVHEIHRDPAGRVLMVCSVRPEAAMRGAIKDLPADADLARIQLGGSSGMVELARLEQSGTQLIYVAMMAAADQPEAGHCAFSVVADALGPLQPYLKEKPASEPITLDVKVPGAAKTMDLRAFANQAYDAVVPMVGLMHRTSLTYSQPLGNALPGREEYVQSLQARAEQELAGPKRP